MFFFIISFLKYKQNNSYINWSRPIAIAIYRPCNQQHIDRNKQRFTALASCLSRLQQRSRGQKNKKDVLQKSIQGLLSMAGQ